MTPEKRIDTLTDGLLLYGKPIVKTLDLFKNDFLKQFLSENFLFFFL